MRPDTGNADNVMDIKLWSKRVVFVTAVGTLLGLTAHAWNQLGLPIPALAADVKNLDKRQSGIGIELYRDRENDLEKIKREYRWKLQEIKRQQPDDHAQQQMIEVWIADLDKQIEAARKKRNEFEERKLFLEKVQ